MKPGIITNDIPMGVSRAAAGIPDGTLLQVIITNDIPVWGELFVLGKIHKNDFLIFVSYRYQDDINFVKVISKYGICQINIAYIWTKQINEIR
jgi:hypothetical protein